MNLSINSFADLKMLEGCVIGASSFYQITKEKIDIYKKVCCWEIVKIMTVVN